jgi:4,5-dihydroxyphthalate decarboxylase
VEPISRAFRRAIRDDEFDVTEMALVTLAMALDAGYSWVGLPVVVMRSFPHGALRVPERSEIRTPHELAGRKIGVRAYSQTTGVWIRGILQQDYGLNADRMLWVTTEDAHVPGFQDPSYVQPAPSGTTLQTLFAAGEIAAAIGDGNTSFSGSRSVIPEPEKASADWYRRTGVYPVNHVIAFRRELLDREPRVADELMRLFQDSRDVRDPSDDVPYGRAVHEKAINLGLEFAFAQGLTRRLYRYDDVFYAGGAG